VAIAKLTVLLSYFYFLLFVLDFFIVLKFKPPLDCLKSLKFKTFVELSMNFTFLLKQPLNG